MVVIMVQVAIFLLDSRGLMFYQKQRYSISYYAICLYKKIYIYSLLFYFYSPIDNKAINSEYNLNIEFFVCLLFCCIYWYMK